MFPKIIETSENSENDHKNEDVGILQIHLKAISITVVAFALQFSQI